MLCTPELGEEDMENLEEVVGAHVRKLKIKVKTLLITVNGEDCRPGRCPEIYSLS